MKHIWFFSTYNAHNLWLADAIIWSHSLRSSSSTAVNDISTKKKKTKKIKQYQESHAVNRETRWGILCTQWDSV